MPRSLMPRSLMPRSLISREQMLKYRRLWITVGWLLVGLVVYLSLTPHPPEPVTFNNADKFQHALAYGALALWFGQIYRSVTSRVMLALALTVLGVGLEYVQGWTGYRTYDVLDMVADGAGVSLGWLLALTPLGRLLEWFERAWDL